MDKKKSEYNSVLRHTGKDGLKGLLWAREQMIQFEHYIKENIKEHNKNHIIFCMWDDNKRRDVYYRGLKDLGYHYDKLHTTFFNNCKVLLKKIN
jgi:hypothetical protein